MTIEAFLQLLDGVKSTRRGWQARCPAHSDKSPSLSIREAEGGLILVHCFAGCANQEICSALHIKPSDLFPHSESNPYRLRIATQQRQQRERAGRQIRAASGLRSDILREAEQTITHGSPIDLISLSAERLDRFLDAIGEAHNILWIEMGGQDYAEWSSRLGAEYRTISLGQSRC